MIRKLSFLLVVILISFLACSDKPNASKQNATIDDDLHKTLSYNEAENAKEIDDLQKALSYNKDEVVQVLDVCFERQIREDKISCLYERFESESVLCGKIEKLVREKCLMQKLEKDFYDPIIGGEKALIMLLNGPLRDNPDVQYLVTHPAYFIIDVDFHNTHPGSVYISKTGLCCAQTTKRLNDLESLGKSDLAWRVREKWLDLYFAIIDMPWDEMASVSAEHFFIEFEKVKQLYNSEEDKKNLQRWVDNAEKILFQKAEKGNIEGYAGKTKAQHLETLRQWVAQMRKGL